MICMYVCTYVVVRNEKFVLLQYCNKNDLVILRCMPNVILGIASAFGADKYVCLFFVFFCLCVHVCVIRPTLNCCQMS